MRRPPAQLGLIFSTAPPPLVLSYGLGVDSTALLVGWHQRGVRPDLILFSDTGGEKDETYAYIAVIRAWLARVGFPDLTVIRRTPIKGSKGTYSTLEGNCLTNEMLPSLAYGGRRGCSVAWKGKVLDAHVAKWAPAIAARAAGQKVLRAIGYDAGPKDSGRCWDITEDAGSLFVYFLREWGWDRARCEREILAAGLPLPPKSACFFCPATSPAELVQLHRQSPHLTARAVAMEDRAQPNLLKIGGLWGSGTKGVEGAQPRPASWREFLRALDAGELNDDGTPKEVGRLPWDGRAIYQARLVRRAEKVAAKQARATLRAEKAAAKQARAVALAA